MSRYNTETLNLQYLTAFGFSQLVILNAVWIRLFLIWLAKKLRYHNLTLETKWIMLSIFCMNSINYGLVYIFGPWDTRDCRFVLVHNLFGGLYTDYNAFWYNDVGILIVQTMIFNMVYPAIEFFIYWPIRFLYRSIDQRRCSCRLALNIKQTRAKTIKAFEEIYSGPLFDLHWKYAYILNVVYMTFLFGAGLPILFPIALVSLILLYCVSKILLAYSYQKPPAYDHKLNETIVKMLRFAPIIYLIQAMWIYSNRQVF